MDEQVRRRLAEADKRMGVRLSPAEAELLASSADQATAERLRTCDPQRGIRLEPDEVASLLAAPQTKHVARPKERK